MAKISIVVPVYNVQPYLARCLDSILGQKFRDFDCVLIDDGSTDESGRICEDFAAKDSRISVMHQDNAGLSAARNAGIDWAFAKSASSYITFIDSDDWVSAEYLENLYGAVESGKARMSACAFLTVCDDQPSELLSGALDKVTVRTAEDFWCLPFLYRVVVWAKLYAKDLWSDIRFPEGKLHEDNFTTHKVVFAAGSVANVRSADYFYLQRKDSILGRPWDVRRLDELEGLEEQLSFLRQHGKYRALAVVFSGFRESCRKNIASVSEMGNKGIARSLRSRFWSVFNTYKVSAKLRRYDGSGCNVFAYGWLDRIIWRFSRMVDAYRPTGALGVGRKVFKRVFKIR